MPSRAALSIARDPPGKAPSSGTKAGKVGKSGRAPGARGSARFLATGWRSPNPESVVDVAPLSRESQPLCPLRNWGPPVQPKAQLLRADLRASSLVKAAVIVPSLEPEALLTFRMTHGDLQTRSCPSPPPRPAPETWKPTHPASGLPRKILNAKGRLAM